MNKFFKGIRILGEFYPPWLLLLVFSPIVIGFIIDPELTDGRYIIINLIWIPIFTIPSILLKIRVVFRIATIIYFIFGVIEIGHWIITRGPVTVTSILVVSNTNTREAIEFLNLKATTGLLILIPYAYLFYLTFRRAPNYTVSKVNPYMMAGIFLVSAIFILENAVNGRLIRKGIPQIAKVVFSFTDQLKLYREIKQDVTPRYVDAKSIFKGRQTFVLIIGESCSRRHMSLYDYFRQTNPKLKNRDNLIVYTDVVAPYSNTINSILSNLSQSNLENKISFNESIDIIDIFHSAGFKTYWISNQPPMGIWENLVTVFAKKSDYCRFVNTVSNSSMEATLTTSYDSKLFKPFISVLSEDVPKKFIVLHLMGSHSKYAKRYPSAFEVFKGTNKEERIIAEFDNSILYNDFIVDSLFSILNSTAYDTEDHMASAIYLSDHGENVYDELDRVGHDYSNELPKSNVEIPFIIWFSPAYERMDHQKAESIKLNVDKPYVADDLFHSILDLNSIQTPYLESERSICNKEFNDRRQRILEDGKDYDR